MTETTCVAWLISQKYAAAETISPLGRRVAAILDAFYGGIYHAPEWRYLRQADWSADDWIEVRHRGSLSTFDFDELTRLVFLAHDYAVRLQLEAVGGPKSLLCLCFHLRQHEGDRFQQHPRLEQAMTNWRRVRGGNIDLAWFDHPEQSTSVNGLLSDVHLENIEKEITEHG